MLFNLPLTTATLVKRYKRFLVDVKLPDQQILTIHCPNTGSMRSCSTPGSLIAFSRSDNPARKYPHTLEMVKVEDTWIGVNTSRTNSLVAEALENDRIGEYLNIEQIEREVTVSKGSRLDLAISCGGLKTYIEVKNCSLVENGKALFPDAVTSRGTKHLHELMRLAAGGYGACIFFLVQRMDAEYFAPAKHIDPLYSDTLKEAAANGVTVLAYQAEVSLTGIEVVKKLPCLLD